MIDTAGGKPPIGRTNYGSLYIIFNFSNMHNIVPLERADDN
jgi:hypothetical protein